MINITTPRTSPLSLHDWLTASDKYPDRMNSLELTPEILSNATTLIDDVNKLLRSLGITKVSVSSGFRPLGVNAKVGGSKASGHLRGLAVDLVDVDGTLATLIAANPRLLRQFGLFLENPKVTKGWVHLDKIKRADRPTRIFNP